MDSGIQHACCIQCEKIIKFCRERPLTVIEAVFLFTLKKINVILNHYNTIGGETHVCKNSALQR